MTNAEALELLHRLQRHFAPGATINHEYWLLSAVVSGSLCGLPDIALEEARCALARMERAAVLRAEARKAEAA